jgi:hypothetical protein
MNRDEHVYVLDKRNVSLYNLTYYYFSGDLGKHLQKLYH